MTVIDETGYGEKKASNRMGVRTAVMSSLEIGKWAMEAKVGKRKGIILKIHDFGTLLRYAISYGMCCRKKVKLVTNIDGLVEQWIEAIVGMCLAHDKDSYDAKDAEADKLLGPLLTAPVKQVREFYLKLLEKMRTDKRVPWLVLMGYEVWGKVVVEDAPDEGVKRLKNKLAGEIAELVEQPIKEQIPEAIRRALRWRDPEALEKIKGTLEKGAKPKLRGRESCLFLEAGRGKNKVSVML